MTQAIKAYRHITITDGHDSLPTQNKKTHPVRSALLLSHNSKYRE